MTTYPTNTTYCPSPPPLSSLRKLAQRLIRIESPDDKATQVRHTTEHAFTIDPHEHLDDDSGIPGRPLHPALVHPGQLKPRAVGTTEGRATLIHALAHIEANAVNLALDVIWRFEGMPERFYRDWLQVAQEEALHFQLLRESCTPWVIAMVTSPPTTACGKWPRKPNTT